MNNIIRDTLIGAKAILNDPSKWAKKALMKDKDGRSITRSPHGDDYVSAIEMPNAVDNPEACSFCMIGAIAKSFPKSIGKTGKSMSCPDIILWTEVESDIQNLFSSVKKSTLHVDSIEGFNDHKSTKYKDVIDVLDKMIEKTTCG